MEGKQVNLQYARGDVCEIDALQHISSETCLQIGNTRISKTAITLLDCRMETSGKQTSGCFLGEDESTIICPSDQRRYLKIDIFETILQIYDACEASSISRQRENMIVLSTELARLTKESSENQKKAQLDLEKVIALSNQLNALLEDSLLVGNQLLSESKSFRRFKACMKEILDEFRAKSVFDFGRSLSTTQDITAMDLDALLAPDIRPASQSFRNVLTLGSESPIWNLFQLERIYSVLCAALFISMVCRSFGNATVAVTAISLLNAVRAVVTAGDYISFAFDTFLSHVICLLVLVAWRATFTMRMMRIRKSKGSGVSRREEKSG